MPDGEVKIKLKLDAAAADPELKRVDAGLERTRGMAGGLAESLTRMATSGFGLGGIGAASIGSVVSRYGVPIAGGFGHTFATEVGRIGGLAEHVAEVDAVSLARSRMQSEFGMAAGAGHMSEAALQRIFEKAYLPFARMETEGNLRIDRATNHAQAEANLGSTVTNFLKKAVDALPDWMFR